MKVIFIIPDGVGIRNYLYSDVIKHLKEKAEIVFWSPLPKEAFTEVIDLHEVEIRIDSLKLPVENILTRFFREAATYARLVYDAGKVDNKAI